MLSLNGAVGLGIAPAQADAVVSPLRAVLLEYMMPVIHVLA
jgi:hypothetical protein